MKKHSDLPILVVDDDLDDCAILREAIDETGLVNKVFFVHDGEQLLRYLRREAEFKNPASSPKPGLIFLDLNMPKKNGRETLIDLKNDPELKHIPVVILTTSSNDEEVFRGYNLGVNSFITKPVDFNSLVEVLKEIEHYWLELVELPRKAKNDE